MRPHGAFFAAALLLFHVCTSVAAQGLRADRGRETSPSAKRNLVFDSFLGELTGSDSETESAFETESEFEGGGSGGDPPGAEEDPFGALEITEAGLEGGDPVGPDFFTDNFVDQTPLLPVTYELSDIQDPANVDPDAFPTLRVPFMLGAEVFNVDVSGYKDGTTPTFQKIADQGFGNRVNKYAWTQEIDELGNICIGTFNINFDGRVAMEYYGKVEEASARGDLQALLDAFGRLWSGSPVTYTDGGETYCRPSDSFTWTMVHKLPKQHTGFRGMTRYDGKFFGGSANGPDGPGPDEPYNIYDLYRVEGGPRIWSGTHERGTWNRLESGSHLNGYDRSIRAMCTSSYTNKLYAGTETLTSLVTAARLISYDANAPPNQQWATYRPVNFGLAAITECLEISEGFLFVAATGIPAFQLFTLDEKNGYIFEDITGDMVDVFNANHLSKGGSGVTPRNVILELRIFKGNLYMGILDDLGAQLFRTPLFGPENVPNLELVGPEYLPSWEPITIDGFAKEQEDQRDDGTQVATNPYTWCGAILDDVYYIGTYGSDNPSFASDNPRCNSTGCRDDGRGQLFASTDGTNWTLLVADTFGENWSYGLRTMVADPVKKMLSIGSASNFFLPVITAPPFTSSSDATVDMGSMALQPDSIISLYHVMDRLGVPHS